MSEPASMVETPAPRSAPRFSRELKIAFAIYLVALGAYAGASGKRLLRPSNDNHYVYLAHGWLHGRLDLGGPPPHANDWAQVDWLHLKDGRLVKGVFAQGASETFRTLRGKVITIKPDEIASKETKTYVSFPPFPAVVMLPIVAIAGMRTNDVILVTLIASLAPALLFLLLRKLRRRGDSGRSEVDDLWLTSVLGVGSVFYFSAVRGEVWYTAHVVSVILMILYTWASLDGEHPFWAGLCLVCGFLTRPELLFAAPLFLWQASRACSTGTPLATGPLAARARDYFARLDKPAALRSLLLFGAPIAVLGLGAAVLNAVRFERLTEFGHTYLNVIQQSQIQKFGLFNFTYLGRNLSCAFALMPSVVAGSPFIKISWHGMAMWVTTPVLFYLLWPRVKGPLHRPLWITVACVAIPDLFYQNSGFVQFGYRFSLDYMVFLVVLLALGGRPLTRFFKGLCVYAFAINLFGAITFYWASQFYFNSYFPAGIN